MKFFRVLSVALIAGGLSACGQAGSGDVESKNESLPAVDFSGKYTFYGNCNGSERVLTVSATAIELLETQCTIDKAIGLGTSTSQYHLSNCRSNGREMSDRVVTISEIEDDLVEVSGWGTQKFTFQTCS